MEGRCEALGRLGSRLSARSGREAFCSSRTRARGCGQKLCLRVDFYWYWSKILVACRCGSTALDVWGVAHLLSFEDSRLISTPYDVAACLSPLCIRHGCLYRIDSLTRQFALAISALFQPNCRGDAIIEGPCAKTLLVPSLSDAPLATMILQARNTRNRRPKL
jgi:hypothetical protein